MDNLPIPPEQNLEQPVVTPPPKINPLFIIGGLIIIAIILTGGIFIGRYLTASQNIPVREITPSPSSYPSPTVTSISDPTTNWKTYTDLDGKFKFQYSNKLIPKDQKIQPDANEYTQLFKVFTIFMGDSTPEFEVRVRNGFNSQQMEKEDFDYMEGHVNYKIIKREEINLSGKKAVKISIFVGPPEDFRETSGVIYIYSDIDLQESLSIRQLGVDTDQFNKILSTFRFLDHKQNLEQSCRERDGRWIAQYNECESESSPNLTVEWCTSKNGKFEGCSSACRHDSDVIAGRSGCADVCVKVCKFD